MGKNIFGVVFIIFWNFPGLSYFVRRSYPFICLYYFYLYNSKNFIKAYELIFAALIKPYFRKVENYEKWWSLMRLLVTSLQEQQIKSLRFNPVMEEKVM